MEIKHRKQWLTGKMIAQVRADNKSPWQDAGVDQIHMSLYQHWQRGFDDGCAKGRESRCVDALHEIQTLQAANKNLELRVFSMKMDALDLVNPDPLRHALEQEIQDMRRQLSEAQGRLVELQGSAAPAVAFATGGYAKSTAKTVDALLSPPPGFVVPHHGVGLCEAEESLRDAE